MFCTGKLCIIFNVFTNIHVMFGKKEQSWVSILLIGTLFFSKRVFFMLKTIYCANRFSLLYRLSYDVSKLAFLSVSHVDAGSCP